MTLVALAGCSFANIRSTPDADHSCHADSIAMDLIVPVISAVIITSLVLDEHRCSARDGHMCGLKELIFGVPAGVVASPFAASAVYGAIVLPRCKREARRREAATMPQLVEAIAMARIDNDCEAVAWLAPEIYRRGPRAFEVELKTDAVVIDCAPALTAERIRNLRRWALEMASRGNCDGARNLRTTIYALHSASGATLEVPVGLASCPVTSPAP